jgi:predicted nucleotidyltransferase
MLQQEAMIERTRRACREDERLAAAMMYGSLARGKGDGFSNIEFILFFRVVNWFVFGSNLFARGELARSLDLLGIVRDRLLQMVRLLEGSTFDWFDSAKFLETEISQTSYARYAACTARLDRDELRQACLSAWEWGGH